MTTKPYQTQSRTGYNSAGAMRASAPQATSTGAFNSPSAASYSNVPYSGGVGYTYENTQLPVVAHHKTICGIPYGALISLVAVIFYITCAILILTNEHCNFDHENTYLFVMLWVSIVSISLLAGIDILYPRYKNNFFGLTISLIYSGSIGLMAGALYINYQNGVCPVFVGFIETEEVYFYYKYGPRKGIYTSCWNTALVGLLFQILAYYFYG